MSNEDNDTGVDLRSSAEKRDDDKIDKLMEELAALEPGVTVVIQRRQPSWCKGQLEKLTVGEEGLDLEYLKRTWGGQLLALKIQDSKGHWKGTHTVELYSFPPRVYGKLLKEPNLYHGTDEPPEPPAPPPPLPPPAAADNRQTELMIQMFQLMQAQHQSEVTTLREIMLAQNRETPQTPRNSISETMAAFKAFSEMREMMGADVAAGGGGDGEAFPGQIMDIMKLFLESKQNAPQARVVPQRQPNPQQRRPAAIVPPASPQVPQIGPQPAPVTPIRNDSDIAGQLTQMDPEKAAETLLMAFGQMPRAKQEVAMQTFISRLGEEMGEDWTIQDEPAETETDDRGTEKSGT